MGLQPILSIFMNTILTVEAKNGPLNGETLNGLKDVKCEQTFRYNGDLLASSLMLSCLS